MFAPVPADTVLPSQIPEGYNFRKYDRKTKKNWGGIAAVTFYCLSLVLYFFVRVTKTMDLGRYMFYGVVVFLIEVSQSFFLFVPHPLKRNETDVLAVVFSAVTFPALTLFLPSVFSLPLPQNPSSSLSPDVRSHHHSHLRRQPGAGPGLRGAGEG